MFIKKETTSSVSAAKYGKRLSLHTAEPPVSLRRRAGSAHTGTPKTYFVRFGEPFFQSTGLSFTPSPPLRYPVRWRSLFGIIPLRRLRRHLSRRERLRYVPFRYPSGDDICLLFGGGGSRRLTEGGLLYSYFSLSPTPSRLHRDTPPKEGALVCADLLPVKWRSLFGIIPLRRLRRHLSRPGEA